MTTALDTRRTPDVLKAAIEEMDRRLAEAARAGRATSTEEPSIVVINDAPDGLTDPRVREAVLVLARMSKRSNMSVELRGHVFEPGLEHFGGSTELYDYATAEDNPAVFYRCLRPMVGVPRSMLIPGVTRVVHNDPRVLASGRVDTGIFMGFRLDSAWVGVQFTDTDNVSSLLAEDLLVEVTPE